MNEAFLTRAREHLGEEAEGCVAGAQETARRFAAEWGLRDLAYWTCGHCSLVWTCSAAQGPAVLKVPVFGEEATTGASAAVAFSGRGGVEVWRHEESTGALLMPKLEPGTKLLDSGLDESTCLRVCISLLRRLPRPADVDGISLHAWHDSFLSVDAWEQSRIDPELLLAAQAACQLLLDTQPAAVLLHGDVHHENILADGAGWTAIDPKGVVGDPAFEATAFFRNQICGRRGQALEELLWTRIESFAAGLVLDPRRVTGWAFVDAVSCCLEGSDEEWNADLAASAEILRAIAL